jgi:hypothetical protein
VTSSEQCALLRLLPCQSRELRRFHLRQVVRVVVRSLQRAEPKPPAPAKRTLDAVCTHPRGIVRCNACCSCWDADLEPVSYMAAQCSSQLRTHPTTLLSLLIAQRLLLCLPKSNRGEARHGAAMTCRPLPKCTHCTGRPLLTMRHNLPKDTLIINAYAANNTNACQAAALIRPGQPELQFILHQRDRQGPRQHNETGTQAKTMPSPAIHDNIASCDTATIWHSQAMK